MSHIKNKLHIADNLDVLHGMNSNTIDLIYLDPPFNSGRAYSAQIGKAKTGFHDIWNWDETMEIWLESFTKSNPILSAYISLIGDIHGSAMKAYLAFISPRIIELHRVLKSTGSLYLHCDPTASHYLKIVLDRVFGKENFRNEIVWCYRTGGASKKRFSSKHDIVLFYSKDKKYSFNHVKDKSYLTGSMSHNGNNPTLKDLYGNYQNILFSKTNIKLYKDKSGYYTMTGCRDYWSIDAIGRTSRERTGYPTQKPVALLRRIIKASSNEGNVVLDPFCGSGTTLVAAKELGRNFIGIDINEEAIKVSNSRLPRTLFD